MSITSKPHSTLAYISSLILVILLGNQSAQTFWGILSPSINTINEDQILDNLFRQSTTQQTEKPQISQLNLYGIANSQPVEAKPIKPISAPVTKLNLKLNGVFAAEPKENSLAIISTSSRDETLYAVDENLPGGAILREVYQDRVIIERSGQLETLLLPKEELKITNEPTRQDTPLLSEQVLRSSPKELRKQILQDPSQLPKVMATVPHYQNGRILGYKLKMKKHHGLLQQYGLMENDVITHVNGIALNNPSNGFKVLQQLTNATSINVDILRNGQRDSLSVSMN